MSRILYSDFLVDSMFLNPRQNVKFILNFFSWAAVPSVLFGPLFSHYLLIDEYMENFISY